MFDYVIRQRAKAILDFMSVNVDVPQTCQFYVTFIRIWMPYGHVTTYNGQNAC